LNTKRIMRDEGDNGSERRCIVTRSSHAPDGLMRFVRAPDGSVVADLKHNLPGRGAWVTARRTMVAEAVRKGLFKRALKEDVAVATDLPDQVEALLTLRARESLSLANKAGEAVPGFTKVETALRSGRVIGLIAAEDGAEDGQNKLKNLVKSMTSDDKSSILCFSGLDSTDLGLAFGRSHVIHAALIDGPAARAAVSRLQRLHDYKADNPLPAQATDILVGTDLTDGTARITAE
jgi:predicted RNA-binding protein YlxR (DUF448 family)/ribosomal protein L30E